ncbi:hypothetical protein PMIT1323_00816 [Prochlorococcus marinus str. MIT 1323]|nr:hypothetical protein PMIT1323_00816 [Prochlorococcus marinus str. MIT 1323]
MWESRTKYGTDKQQPYMTYHLLYYIDDLPTKLKTNLSLEKGEEMFHFYVDDDDFNDEVIELVEDGTNKVIRHYDPN